MKLMSVTVRGKQKNWCFRFYGEPEHLPDWRADGLEVSQIENTIPHWLPAWVPTRVWIFMQDVFNFNNPFGK